MKPVRRLALLVALVSTAPLAVAAAEPLDEALYARILERFTSAVPDPARVRVDYPGLARSGDWQRLIRNVGQTQPSELATRDARLAYWINVYNIFAIDLVVRNQPLGSIKDIGSLFSPVWKREAGRVGGRPYTLDQIEHEILRPMGEPRIHAAIVCASVSCPSLRREPWTAARLDEQLEDTLRRWLSDPQKGLAVDRAARTVRLSRVFDWFEEDFGGREGVLRFVAARADESDRAWLEGNAGRVRVDYLDYDWSLNDLAGGARGG